MNKTKLLFMAVIIFCLNIVAVSLIHQNQVPRTFFSKDINFELKHEFDFLNKYIAHAESVAEVHIDNHGEIFVVIGDFRRFKGNDIDTVLNDKLHVTEALGLYSLNYIATFLENITKPDQIKALINMAKMTLEHIDSLTIIPDRMKFNDHVVAARLEALLLIKAFLSESPLLISDQDSKFSDLIDRHIGSCVNLLLDDKFFTWRTNHGLMQIRALLSFELSTKENYLSASVRNKINKRLNDNLLLDYHINKDGSVFEAATGYWKYVYSQWNCINSFPFMRNHEIQSRLKKTKNFLNAVTTSQCYLQGVGDSYCSYQKNDMFCEKKVDNYVYRFGNGVAGLNIMDANLNNLHLHFISLDNPPYVKKHPEDLSIYLYYNQPFFINPGIYAWDNSLERRNVKSQEVQNTLYLSEKSAPDASDIFIDNNEHDGQIVLYGLKRYGNEKLTRRIVFDKTLGEICVEDMGRIPFNSGFNIHPGVKIKRIDSNHILLKGEKGSIELRSSIPIEQKTVKVSNAKNSLIEVSRLEMRGDSINHCFTLNGFSSSSIEIELDTIADNTNMHQRWDSSVKLSKYYWQSEFYSTPTSKRLVYPRVFLLIVVLIIIIVARKRKFLVSKIFIFYTVVCVVDMFLHGMLLSISFY